MTCIVVKLFVGLMFAGIIHPDAEVEQACAWTMHPIPACRPTLSSKLAGEAAHGHHGRTSAKAIIRQRMPCVTDCRRRNPLAPCSLTCCRTEATDEDIRLPSSSSTALLRCIVDLKLPMEA
jgi:hypothetical protein